MIYVCKTEHVKTGKTHVFRTVYDFKRGDIIYPPGTCKANTPDTMRTGTAFWSMCPGQPDSIAKAQLFGQASV